MGERTASPTASGGPSGNGADGGKAYVGVKPEELEEARFEMIQYVLRMVGHGTRYFDYVRRMMYGEGFTLPFETETSVKEGEDGMVVEVRVRVHIPNCVLPKYVDLKRRKLIGEIFR